MGQIMVLKTLLQLREVATHRLIPICEGEAGCIHGEPDQTFSGTGRRSLCIRNDSHTFCRRCCAFIRFFLCFAHSRWSEYFCFF